MATTTEPAEGERRFVLYNVGWEGYQALLNLLGDHGPRLAYDRGNVELMSPLFQHEQFKCLLRRLVWVVTEELDIPRISAGSTTFNRQSLDCGLEPDESFFLGDLDRIHDPDRIGLEIDLPPDLAIEIEITRSGLNRLGIYAALRFPEVWRFDGETLSVLLLQEAGSYAASSTSAAFPFLSMGEVTRWLKERDTTDDTRWSQAFRDWVRTAIVPGARGGDQPSISAGG